MALDPLAHRKGARRLRVLNPDRSPAAHQAISIWQTGDAFLFGCGAFDTIPLTNGTLSAQEQTAMEDRLAKWLSLFNYGTLPFYWGRFEPSPGEPHTKEVLRAARWLQARGVRVKGHPLCWHTVTAPWLLDKSNAEILKAQLARIDREVRDFAGVIDMWDVINEVVIMPIFDKYDNGVTRVCKELGRVRMIREVFAAAKAANPGATLLLNDFNTSIEYELLIDGCLNAGVPIDAIGIQSHQHQRYWGEEKLRAVLERFNGFGLPIHFTENTILSGDLMPAHITDLNDWQVADWPTTPEGEARQVQQVTQMYEILFEHPLVEAITTWDHVDGKWLGAPSGFLRKDNSEKPANQALKALIHEKWRTKAELTTDADGETQVEGYWGTYTAQSGGGRADFQLSRADPSEQALVIQLE
jgi:GH35 family endo-1,4-beta-xylanase